jgi:CO/xanthine dehydrogenase Mo-binding subunit
MPGLTAARAHLLSHARVTDQHRDDALGLTGTQYGGGRAQCGARSAALDGKAVRCSLTTSNLFWGKLQGTDGSTPIAHSYEQMRKAGAAVRHMLVAAAARRHTNRSTALRRRSPESPCRGQQLFCRPG